MIWDMKWTSQFFAAKHQGYGRVMSGVLKTRTSTDSCLQNFQQTGSLSFASIKQFFWLIYLPKANFTQ